MGSVLKNGFSLSWIRKFESCHSFSSQKLSWQFIKATNLKVFLGFLNEFPLMEVVNFHNFLLGKIFKAFPTEKEDTQFV